MAAYLICTAYNTCMCDLIFLLEACSTLQVMCHSIAYAKDVAYFVNNVTAVKMQKVFFLDLGTT